MLLQSELQAMKISRRTDPLYSIVLMLNIYCARSSFGRATLLAVHTRDSIILNISVMYCSKDERNWK